MIVMGGAEPPTFLAPPPKIQVLSTSGRAPIVSLAVPFERWYGHGPCTRSKLNRGGRKPPSFFAARPRCRRARRTAKLSRWPFAAFERIDSAGLIKLVPTRNAGVARMRMPIV